MCLRESIAPIWDNIQYDLFPALESSYEALSKEYKQLAAILELVRIEEFLPHTTRNSWGRNIFYKGYTKVFSHVIFGVLALTATLLIKLVQ